MLGKKHIFDRKIKAKIGELRPCHQDNKLSGKRYQGVQGKEKWDTLKESLECGYHPDMYMSGHIKVFWDGIVIDGNHRVHALKEIYGDDYEITVRKIGYIHSHIFLPLLVLLSFPISILNFLMYLEIGFRGKVYRWYHMLLWPILKPIKLIMYLDRWSRSKVTLVKKIISFNKNNPYKHHEK